MKPTPLLLAALLATPASAAVTLVGVYDEQSTQPNAVDFSMPYSNNTTWTTGIGQVLGAKQVLTAAEFTPLAEAAHTVGRGGVINFDTGTLTDSQTLHVNFADGSKGMTLTNHPDNGGTYAIGGVSGNRTAISGTNSLGRSGTPHFDFVLGGFAGFEPDEHVTAVGVTLLGRNGTGGNSNWRVIAFYTNGTESGSSSTFRSLNTNTGNTTHDSFTGIIAPDGYWITRLRVHSDSGAFTSIDDLAIITKVIPEPSTALLGMIGFIALLIRRK
jgi:hypothetical protein